MDIKNYSKGAAQRTAQRKIEAAATHKPLFPNIAQARAEYDPAKDGPRTMAQLAEDQAQLKAEGPQEKGLSGDTVRGLQELKKLEEVKMTQQAEAPKEQTVEDIEILNALRGVHTDMLNNEKERAAVALRVEPIDLGKGLMGEFTQQVPIVKEQLVVTYRSFTAMEAHWLRVLLYRVIEETPELERVADELHGLYQTVASIKKFNDTEQEPHIVRPNGVPAFSEEVFKRKVLQFQQLPIQLIGALGIHGSWFDLRVRELFVSVEPLKNG